MGIQNEDVKRKRVLFSLNVQPQYENAIIDAQIEFYSNSIIFVENIANIRIASLKFYLFIFRGVPDLLYKLDCIYHNRRELTDRDTCS